MTLSLWLAASACAAQTFSFAVLADTHVGRRVPDFGTPGYDDELRGLPRANERLRRVRVALDKVRALREKQDIRVVVVVGDLTEHGERSEFLAARALFDALPIPYVPVLGNHDVWPGTSREEAPEPIGDRYFEETFAPAFAALETLFPGFRKARTPVDNPEVGGRSYFQNAAFSYQGYGFVALDWVSRRHAPFGLPRGHTHADIHDFPGGTYRWLRGLRDSGWAKAHKRVFVFQHHSTRGTPWQPSPITGFNGAEKRRLRELLGREPFWGVFAGHLHREYDGGAFGVFEASEPPPVGKLRQVETSATARDATVTVVRVDDDGAVEVLRF